MIKRNKPLKRSAKPIPRVSAKRRREMVLYSEKRRLFLAKFFLCMVDMAEKGFDPKIPPVLVDDLVFVASYDAPPGQTWVHSFPLSHFRRATELHHRKKRGKNYLNEETFMAVSAYWHREIENRKSWARSKQYLA